MTLSEMVLKTLSSLCRVWIGRRGDGLNPPPPDELSFFLPFYYFFLSSSRSSTSLFFPPLFSLLPPVTSLPWDALSSTTPTHLNVILTKWKRAQSFKLVTCFDVAARRGKRWILPSFFFWYYHCCNAFSNLDTKHSMGSRWPLLWMNLNQDFAFLPCDYEADEY